MRLTKFYIYNGRKPRLFPLQKRDFPLNAGIGLPEQGVHTQANGINHRLVKDIDNQRVPAKPREDRQSGLVHPTGGTSLLNPHAHERTAEKTEQPGQQREIIRARNIPKAERVQPILGGQPVGQFHGQQSADAEIASAIGIMRRGDPPGDQHQKRTGRNADPGRNMGEQRLEQGKQQDGNRQNAGCRTRSFRCA